MKKFNFVKAFAVMAIMTAGAFFAGCANPAGAGGSSYSAKYAVGDIILNDGSKVNYETAKTYTESDLDELKAKAIAVIFRADTVSKKALGVGLKHDTRAWCTIDATAYSTIITTIRCPASGDAGNLTFTGDTDGSDNLEQIGTFLTEKGLVNDTAEAAKYPAFYFAKNYKNTATNLTSTYENGWYLPTIAELFDIWKVKAIVDAASNLCGGSQFGTSYSFCWSSSQYAYNDSFACGFIFYDGDWSVDSKNYKFYFVCAVRAFN
ncbi:MAG: DUF1566 domain-containing protein [Treponema sp.]|uniref:hypothetical protein n=1 Tax=Treponema sp. TaxID=166 RepID=UPI00298DD9F7|nr:hypothetical protein [Treponema sp.]MCQ2600412.1 DUF1566 domain-containing protein [Treponema sp.]